MSKKLNKKEMVSEHERTNPIFNLDADYSKKVYRKIIKKMNNQTSINMFSFKNYLITYLIGKFYILLIYYFIL